MNSSKGFHAGLPDRGRKQGTTLQTDWVSFGKPIWVTSRKRRSLEKTSEFRQARTAGEISTLSFYFEHDGEIHSVMVTDDGAVVLQDVYHETADEIGLVLDLKRVLLDGICAEHDIQPSRRAEVGRP